MRPAAAAAPDPGRFVAAAVFCCTSFAYAGSWMCFAPVAQLAAGAPHALMHALARW
jgi:hypothetical protein